MSGLVCQLKNVVSRCVSTGRPDDDALANQVRLKLDMLSRHAHMIEVTVQRGCVTLQGPIVADEVQYLSKIIAVIPGVKKVHNRLKEYPSDEEIPKERNHPPPAASPDLKSMGVISQATNCSATAPAPNHPTVWFTGLAFMGAALTMVFWGGRRKLTWNKVRKTVPPRAGS